MSALDCLGLWLETIRDCRREAAGGGSALAPAAPLSPVELEIAQASGLPQAKSNTGAIELAAALPPPRCADLSASSLGS